MMQDAREDLRQDTKFFGRAPELYELVRNLQRGRHTLIVGPKGIGKTRLMLEARWIMSGRTRRIDFSSHVLARIRGQLGFRVEPGKYRILFLEHASPLGDCLRETLEQMFFLGDFSHQGAQNPADWEEAKKSLSGLGAVKLQGLILEGIARAGKPYLIFIDSLDRISPGQHRFLEELLTASVLCAAVVHIRENIVFKRIWASFTRIDLGPMPENVSRELLGHLMGRYEMHVLDRELYTQEVLKTAGGNPFLMKTLLWHGSREHCVSPEEVRRLRRVGEGQYFNMGPIYIFGVASFTLYKIFSIGTDNREFTIYFSALGFLAYLIFRVFRAFFIFRPQKYQ